MPKPSTGFLKLWVAKTADLAGADSLANIFANCVIDFYDGTPPADADDAITTQTYLGRATLNGGAFTEGVATHGLVWDSPIVEGTGTGKYVYLPKPTLALWAFNATGFAGSKTATWARLRGNATDAAGLSNTLPRIQYTVSTNNGTGEIKLANTTFIDGQVEQLGTNFKLKVIAAA